MVPAVTARGSVAVTAVMTMSGVVPVRFRDENRFVHRATIGAKARKLESAGKKHNHIQAGDVHGLLDEVADVQSEEIERAGPGGDSTPDEDHHRPDQHQPHPAPFGESL